MMRKVFLSITALALLGVLGLALAEDKAAPAVPAQSAPAGPPATPTPEMVQGIEKRFTQAYYNMGEPQDVPLKIDFSTMIDHSQKEETELEDTPEVRIGVIALLSGPAKAYGEEMLKGVQMAADEINAAGGLNGKLVKLYIRDDKGDMGRNGNEWVKAIYEDKVHIILGSVGSDTTHVGIRVTLHSEVPSITSISTDPTITQVFTTWSFRCLADDWAQGRALAKLIYDDLGYRKIAAFEQDNRYGRMGITEFKRVSRRKGFPVRVSLKFNSKQTSFTNQCEVMKQYDPEGIVIWGLYNTVGPIVKELRRIGVTCPIFGSDGIVSPAYFQTAGEAADGNVVTYPYDPTVQDPVNLAFIKQFQERYGYEPDSFAAHGYDATYLAWSAIKKAGLNRGRIRDELSRTTNFHGATGFITFDKMNNDQRPVIFAVIDENKFRIIKKGPEEIREFLKAKGYKVPDAAPMAKEVEPKPPLAKVSEK